VRAATAVIFFNYRTDRARQILTALFDPPTSTASTAIGS
jgi:bisphosphoglycerate-independent phosphoglycerate mutase (AlkP superfamily)